MPWRRHDDTCPFCPGVEAGPCAERTPWAKLNVFKERTNDSYKEQSALRREVSPSIPSALMHRVKEKPFRALTEISLSRVMRMTYFIQLFLFTLRLPKQQVVSLLLSCSEL